MNYGRLIMLRKGFLEYNILPIHQIYYYCWTMKSSTNLFQTEQWDLENPETLTLNEVEVGIKYAMLISTSGGLWRYLIGDTIEFTSLEPHLLKIAGRTKHFINAFWRRVDDRQTLKVHS